jgi:hypothetical protein
MPTMPRRGESTRLAVSRARAEAAGVETGEGDAMRLHVATIVAHELPSHLSKHARELFGDKFMTICAEMVLELIDKGEPWQGNRRIEIELPE